MKVAKRIVLSIFALFFALTFPLSSINTVNAQTDLVTTFIYNSSFEQSTPNDFFGNNEPSYWTIKKDDDSNSAYLNVESNSGAYDGKSQLNITSKGTHVLTTNEFSTVSAGETYRVGVKFKTKNAQATCKVSITAYKGSSLYATYDGAEFKSTVLSEWTDAFVDFTADSGVNKIKVAITAYMPDSNFALDFVYSYKLKIFTDTGASLRLSETQPGLRFSGKVEKSFYDSCVQNYTDVRVGMIIIPKDYLLEINEVTFKSTENKTVLNIVASKWNNDNTCETDGYYGFNCAIVDIKESNITREFCARAYLTYTDNGTVKYVYSDFVIENHVRSISNVALVVMEEIDFYDTWEQDIIKAYANGIKPTIIN